MTLPSISTHLEVAPDGTRTVVRFTGCDSLNEFNSEAVGRQLARVVEEGCPHLVLDLSSIRYATSSALGEFIGLNRRLKASGGRLILLAPTPAVSEVLAITRLDTILEVHRPSADADGPRTLLA